MRTDVQISIFYAFFLSHVVHLFYHLPGSLGPRRGSSIFCFNEKSMGKAESGKFSCLSHGGPSPLVDTASQSPAQPSAWPLPPPFNSPNSPWPESSLHLLSLHFYLFPARVQSSYFVYLLPRPRCVFINRLFLNVSNVRGLNYQYLHI